MTTSRIQGLVAAVVTPLRADGSLHLEAVPALVEHLIAARIRGLYVCGSTGGGVSLTDQERIEVAEAFIDATASRATVMVQVGHNCLEAAAKLARHASDAGADVVSATCPSYFKIDNVETLVDSMELVAGAAGDLPFYFYHIPVLTSVNLDMVQFLELGSKRIPNLAGIKYSAPTLQGFQHCQELDDGKFDVLWGVDEMLLGALATGAEGAIGSTYNVGANLYHRIIDAFHDGRLTEARQLQSQANAMIRVLLSYPFHSALRVALKFLGLDCGPCRLPQPNLTVSDEQRLYDQLQHVGFFEFAGVAATNGGEHRRTDDGANGASAPVHAMRSSSKQRDRSA